MPSKKMANARHDALFMEYEESWMPHHRDIMEHMSPRRGFWKGDRPNKGDKKNGKILDSGAMLAKRVLQAGMSAGTVSPNWPWMRLTMGEDSTVPRFGPQRNWLAQVERILYGIFRRSNFYRVMPTMFSESALVATAMCQIDANAKRGIHCTQHQVGTYALDVDAEGNVDTMARRTWMTVGRIVKLFGLENVSEATRRHYNSGELGEWKQVRHLVEPNDERIYSMPDARGMPFRSLWWEKDEDGDENWLRAGGFREFPIPDLRWEVTGESVYGTDCPGMMALPDVREVMKSTRNKGEAVDKQVRPPLEIPTSYGEVDLTPAAENEVDALGGQQRIRPILQINPPIAELRADIQEIKSEIREAFFVDLFITILANQSNTPQRTATEIASIEGEKLLMLGPVLERVFFFLDRSVDRTFNLAWSQGRIPPPPPGMEGEDINVEFVSSLAQAQKAVQAVTIERGVGFIGGLAGVKPDVVDIVDLDEVGRTHWHMLGASPEPMRTDDEIAALREARAQREQMAATPPMAAAAKDGATAAKVLSETDVSSDSALQRLLAGGPTAGGDLGG